MKFFILGAFLFIGVNVFAQRVDTLHLIGTEDVIEENYVIVYETLPQKFYKKCFCDLFSKAERQLLKTSGLINFHLIIDIESKELIELFSPRTEIDDVLLTKIHDIFIKEIKFDIHKVVSVPMKGKYLYIITAIDLRDLPEKRK
jgi:hypothetical protein